MIKKLERRKKGKLVGHSWQVRYIDENGVKRSVTRRRYDEAKAIHDEVSQKKRTGDLWQLEAGKQLLSEFIYKQYWPNYALSRLAKSTVNSYQSHIAAHILPHLGGLELRAIRPDVVETFQGQLLEEGVGNPAIRRTMALLQGIFGYAERLGYATSNPVRVATKPKVNKPADIDVPDPKTIEKLRQSFLASNQLMNATICSVLAYSGLRPGEALALQWENILKSTIRVDHSLSYGELKEPKTARGKRKVNLLKVLRDDLEAWRIVSGFTNKKDFVFPAPDGQAWTDGDYRSWRRYRYVVHAKGVGLKSPRPYDLRHGFVSLLIQEGKYTIVEIAQQLGHEPTMTLNRYAKVMDEFAGKGKIDANKVIRAARADVAAKKSAKRSKSRRGKKVAPDRKPRLRKTIRSSVG